MYLTKLINSDIKAYKITDIKLKISGISCDSRQIKKGMLFVVINGNTKDSIKYITEAIKSGATAILCKNTDLKTIKKKINNILVCKNIRLAIANIAKQFFPRQPDHISAVTGTNGKTSVVNFLYDIWKKNKVKGACFGTLGIKYDGINKKTKLTTLDSISLHKELNLAKEKKINFLAMEASSHALDQSRLDKVKIKYGLFTNLSRDHLDYHKNMKKYFLCKSKLFEFIMDRGGVAIINTDNGYGKKIKELCDINNIKNLSYGFQKGSSWRIINIDRSNKYTQVKFKKNNRIYIFKCNLIADYEVENLIAAIILANLNGLSIKSILENIKKIKQPQGRLKKIPLKNYNISVFIDYAHTPEALQKSLKALRLLFKFSGKLILVFGCGGERDKGKRKIMGRIANQFADKVIITDDNPRYENAKSIRTEIASTCKKSICISDRKKAIYKAVNLLKKNDILLIAGKGHEKYQEINGKVLPFNDELIVKKIVSNRFAV